MKLTPYIKNRIHRNRNDFEVQSFTCGGHGGQHRDHALTGCRVVDKVTGMAVRCTEQRNWLQNRTIAFERLVKRLFAFYVAEEEQQLNLNQKQYPTHRVRTYHEQQNRVTDHRTNKNYDYTDTLNGKISTMIDDLMLMESMQNA